MSMTILSDKGSDIIDRVLQLLVDNNIHLHHLSIKSFSQNASEQSITRWDFIR